MLQVSLQAKFDLVVLALLKPAESRRSIARVASFTGGLGG
jgi:hypothetical protein